MVVLDSPTYNCTLEETEYGLAKTCVGALLAALGGLRGLSISSHDLVQVFTVLPMGSELSDRCALVRPDIKPFAIEGQERLYQHHVHGYAEYTDGGVVSRVFIVSCSTYRR
jgi:hypothetical protein